MSGVAIVNLPSLDHTQIVSSVEAMGFHGMLFFFPEFGSPTVYNVAGMLAYV